MNFYEPHPNSNVLRQGDIVGPVPFFHVKLERMIIIQPDAQLPVAIDITSDRFAPGAMAVVPAGLSLGIIVTQCCDLARKSPILLARVSPWEESIKKIKADMMPKERVEKINTLANAGKTPSLFFLPKAEGADFPKSVAEFGVALSLPPDSFPSLQKMLRYRLADAARLAFQNRLCYSLGRYAAPDDLYYDAEEWQHIERQRTTKQQNVQDAQ